MLGSWNLGPLSIYSFYHKKLTKSLIWMNFLLFVCLDESYIQVKYRH